MQQQQSRKQRVRSYAIRGTRMATASHRALEQLLPRYQASKDDWNTQQGRRLEVEIGCGAGESVLHYAQTRPDSLQIAFEVYPPVVASLLKRLQLAELPNVRVQMQDALVRLPELALPASLASIRVLYPDPWPKRRHHKRRLLDADFLLMARRLLAANGELLFATDWRKYYEQVVKLAQAGDWKIAATGDAARDDRPPTRFELRASKEGRASFNLLLRT